MNNWCGSFVVVIQGGIGDQRNSYDKTADFRRGLRDKKESPLELEHLEGEKSRLHGLHKSHDHLLEWIKFSKWLDDSTMSTCWERLVSINPSTKSGIDALPSCQRVTKHNHWDKYLSKSLKDFHQAWPYPTLTQVSWLR